MACKLCGSPNIKLLKIGIFTTGYFCNNCGTGRIDYYKDGCCGNQNHVDIRFEQSNGVIVQRVACKNCRKLVSGAKKKSQNFASLSLYSQSAFLIDQENSNKDYQILSDYIKELSEKFRQEQSDKWWDNYSKYLQSDKWKSIRLKILDRESYLCQGCKISKADHVHHTTYDNMGDELLFQLIALCHSCHKKLHPNKLF